MKHLLAVVAGACCLIVPAQNGAAQTIFAWPESKVNLTEYRYLDNCIAAGARVWDSVRSAQAIFLDTMFSTRGRIGESVPAKVQTSFRECLSNYTPTQIPREYSLLAQKAYLYAGQFAESNAAVQHGLSQIAATDTPSRAAFLDSVIQQYATNPPYQLQFVQSYIDTLERYGTAYRSWNLLRDYFWLMHAAFVANEDSIAFRAAHRVFDLAPSATKGASAQEIYAVGIGVRIALRIVRGNEVLDSLRKGTAAYAALYAAQFRQAMGFVPTDQPRDMEAPVLQGDYWFPAAAASQEYPRKGRVSLLVFAPDRMQGGNGPAQMLSQLRRLTQKYPSVDLIMTTSTRGNFGPLDPPSPEREAFIADSVFRHFHRLNPIVSVTKGPFVQFDTPDDRRFYQPYPNLDAYPPPGGDLYSNGKTMRIFLIDTDRRIVDLLPPSADEEWWTMRLIETLLTRTTGGQGQ